jgi:hypothetical protein
VEAGGGVGVRGLGPREALPPSGSLRQGPKGPWNPRFSEPLGMGAGTASLWGAANAPRCQGARGAPLPAADAYALSALGGATAHEAGEFRTEIECGYNVSDGTMFRLGKPT